MAVSSNFTLVREAFCANLFANLPRLNVTVKSASPKGDWIQIACPMCSDKSGSASISHKSGWLTCHQCGSSVDLFTWVGQVQGLTKPWEVCQSLASLLGVQVQGIKRTKIKVVPAITLETEAELRHRLFDDEEAEPVRALLKQRKLWIPDKLEQIPVGSIGGRLVFFQYSPDGTLIQRARTYDPFPKPGFSKWGWNIVKGYTGRSTAFWPHIPYYNDVAPDKVAIVCEGEWDTLSLLLRLGFFDKKIIAATWTGGAGGHPPLDSVPHWLRKREVQIIYDNDVFQGVGVDDVAPDEKKAKEMSIRKKNLIEYVAGSLAQSPNKCSVFIRAITVPPLEKWGADLRDMIDAGLESIESLPVWPLSACRSALLKAQRVEFNDVHKHLNQYIEFRCQVAGVAEDVIAVPTMSRIECEKGQHKYCDGCGLGEVAPETVLDWSTMPDKLMLSMTSHNMPQTVMEKVVRKPGICKKWSLSPLDSFDGARWTAMAREDDNQEGSRTVEILSRTNPPLSGELLVRGWLFISNNGTTPILYCDYLEVADRVHIPIEPHMFALRNECPPEKATVADIDEFLDRWHKDVSNNVTHIYGRRDMHVALGLTMHSALWFDALGARRRGWLDTCIFGATRTGKSAATRAYIKCCYGQHFTPMGNFSRAGLTLGTVSINGQSKMRPGVLPRNHGKLCAIDEAHLMTMDSGLGGNIFPMLQGARDIGKVEAVKISGSSMLPAACRLIAIANWMNGGKNAYATPAEHLLALYGTPESLARMDFAVPVDEIGEGFKAEQTNQFWTQERQRALVSRAWNMQPADIVFDEEAIEEAVKLCTVTWKDRYTEELPLFTEKEKIYSILRIAVAVSNMTLSHGEKLTQCRVSLVHVQWAAKWLEHTWKLLEYDNVSRGMMQKMSGKQSWMIEALLTAGIKLYDPLSVPFVLGKMFGAMNREEMRAIIGATHQDFETWVMQMVRNGGVDVIRQREKNYLGGIQFRLSKGSIEIVQRLISFAEQCPEGWKRRIDHLNAWFGGGGGLGRQESPKDLTPLDSPMSMHLREQQTFDERFA